MTKMSKAQIAICLDLEHIELLSEVRSKYHLKNMSNAVELVIRQWQMMLEQRQKEHLATQKQEKKPVNPWINP